MSENDVPKPMPDPLVIKQFKTPGTPALILSILGFFGITAILGVILGFVARKEARRTGVSTNKANAAIAIGLIWIGLTVLGVILGNVADSGTTDSPTTATAIATTQDPDPSATITDPTGAAQSPTIITCEVLETQANGAAIRRSKERVDSAMKEAKAAGCEFKRPKLRKLAPGEGWPSREGIAFEWVDDPNCDYFGCSQLNVIARDAQCPNGLYASVNILDKSGTIIGYSNDSLPSLLLGQKARLNFTITEDDAATIALNEFSCY